jgi:hypothetical protein
VPDDDTPFTPEARCDRCQFPAVLRNGKWEHAEYADGIFCFTMFPREGGQSADV